MRSGDIFKNLSPLNWKAFIPVSPTLVNYMNIFKRFPLARFFLNSLVVSLITTILGLLVNSLAAYSLARFNYPGKTWIFGLVLATMMMPFEVLVIPLYLLCKELGLLNTYYALILPGVAHGLSIFLLRQFFIELPRSIEESAVIDGASYLRIYWRIVLPLSKPALVTAGLMEFMASWNAFFWPLIAVSKSELVVFQVGIVFFKNEFMPSWGDLFAASTVGMVPTIVLFVVLQRYYIQGIALTGVKE
jgi:ABC-type glycerol-3-phosphate transport system permease component